MEVPRSDSEAAVSVLPEDILLKVRARLPLVNLVQSRAVCRAWKAALDSPRHRLLLLQQRVEWRAGAGERMLLVAGFRLGESESESGAAKALVSSAYDPASDCWYELSLGLGLGLPTWPAQEEKTLFVELPGASMSPGVLLAKLCQEGLVLHIGNPVAGSWATLPPLALPDTMRICHVRGVLVDVVARRFKVVAVHPGPYAPGPKSTFVFDSAVGVWSLTTSVMPQRNYFRQSSGQGVFVGKVLYCLTETVDLLAYDVERESWSSLVVDKRDIDVNPIPRNSSDYELFGVRGRLLCAASDNKRWEIWELDMDLAAPAWKVVASMPAPMHTEFRGEWPVDNRTRTYSVVAGQDEVYIMRERWDKIKIAAVDFRSTPPAWRLLPNLPYNGFTRKSFHCFDPWLQFGTWGQSQL